MGSTQIKDLLNDEIFYLYFLLFSESVNIINKYNIRLQDQKLCIAGLKSNINECYNAILDLVLKPDLWNQDRSVFLALDFQDWEIQSNYFMEPKEFIQNISEDLSQKFTILEAKDEETRDQFVSNFYDYFARLLNSFKQYLPLEDSLVQILDFVELKDTFPILKKKIEKFCKELELVQNEEEKKLMKEELNKIKEIKIEYYRENSKNVLHMWDHLEGKEKLTILPKIVRIAESLPTSLATIEQSFSHIKLIKTDLRNRLSELSLEGLILVGQEFKNSNKILITQTMTELFEKVSKEFWKKKVTKGKVIKELEQPSQEQVMISQIEEEPEKNKLDPKISKSKSNLESNQEFDLLTATARKANLEAPTFNTEEEEEVFENIIKKVKT